MNMRTKQPPVSCGYCFRFEQREGWESKLVAFPQIFAKTKGVFFFLFFSVNKRVGILFHPARLQHSSTPLVIACLGSHSDISSNHIFALSWLVDEAAKDSFLSTEGSHFKPHFLCFLSVLWRIRCCRETRNGVDKPHLKYSCIFLQGWQWSTAAEWNISTGLQPLPWSLEYTCVYGTREKSPSDFVDSLTFSFRVKYLNDHRWAMMLSISICFEKSFQ